MLRAESVVSLAALVNVRANTLPVLLVTTFTVARVVAIGVATDLIAATSMSASGTLVVVDAVAFVDGKDES